MELLARLLDQPWIPYKHSLFILVIYLTVAISLSRRKVQHYGYRYRYETNDVDPNDRIGPLPDFVSVFISKMLRLKVIKEEPDQLTVNQVFEFSKSFFH